MSVPQGAARELKGPGEPTFLNERGESSGRSWGSAATLPRLGDDDGYTVGELVVDLRKAWGEANSKCGERMARVSSGVRGSWA